MPKGPNGQKRPADAIGLAVMVGRIATGEIEEALKTKLSKVEVASRGGKARAAVVPARKRSEIAQKAARAKGLKPSGAVQQSDQES